MIKTKLKKFLPYIMGILGFLIIIIISFGLVAIQNFSQQKQTPVSEEVQSESSILGIAVAASPEASAAATPSPAIIKKVFSPKPRPSFTPKPTTTPIPSPVNSYLPNNSTNNSPSQPITSLVPTPSPKESSSPSATLVSTPSPTAEKVTVEIKQPDGNISFTIEINNGMNICQLMQKAKNEGKIKTLTIDDKYLSTFNTLLITEINGFKNNWVFTLNGESPMGCSLTSLKNSDKIVWEFLSL